MNLSGRVKAVGLAAVILLVAVAAFIGLSYQYPPLRFSGGVTGIAGAAEDEVNVGWDLDNSGWFPVRVTEVSIDGYSGAVPIWTVGATATHGQMVGGSMARLPQEDGFLLSPLGNFTIPPDRSLPQGERPTDTARTMRPPRMYGLITLYRLLENGQHPVGSTITIHYRYLGLPMTLHTSFTSTDPPAERPAKQCGHEMRGHGDGYSLEIRECLWNAYNNGIPAQMTTTSYGPDGGEFVQTIRVESIFRVELYRGDGTDLGNRLATCTSLDREYSDDDPYRFAFVLKCGRNEWRRVSAR